MQVLKEARLDFRDRRIICLLHRKQKTIIKVGEERESPKIRQEVRQSCLTSCLILLSPVIFNIFIEHAIRKVVESEKLGVKFNFEILQLI